MFPSLSTFGKQLGNTTTKQCLSMPSDQRAILRNLGSPLGKRRRVNADFPGADIILKQISEKPSRKRVGIISSGPPARGRFH
jgi:hypothetical protein